MTLIAVCTGGPDGDRSTRGNIAGRSPMLAAQHYKVPKIDTDTATRDRLVEHIEELEWLLDGLLPRNVEVLACLLGISRQRAEILSVLSSGRVITTEHLCQSIGRHLDDLAPGTVKAQICYLRRRVGRFGIRIKNVWGVGYQLDAASVAVLKAIISGEG